MARNIFDGSIQIFAINILRIALTDRFNSVNFHIKQSFKALRKEREQGDSLFFFDKL